jgi:hypothetical protein
LPTNEQWFKIPGMVGFIILRVTSEKSDWFYTSCEYQNPLTGEFSAMSAALITC